MLGSSGLPLFPIDIRSGQGIDASRKSTKFRFDLNDAPVLTGGSGVLFIVRTKVGDAELRSCLALTILTDRNFTGAPRLRVDDESSEPWLDIAGQPLARVRAGWLYRIFYDPDLDAFRSDSPVLVANEDLAPSPANTLEGNQGNGNVDLGVGDARELLDVDHVANKSEEELVASGPIADALGTKATPENIAAAISPIQTLLATKASQDDVTDAVTPIANRTTVVEAKVVDHTAQITALQASQSSSYVVHDTLAQLNTDLAPLQYSRGEVTNDGVNNGYYVRSVPGQNPPWVKKSDATLAGLVNSVAALSGLLRRRADLRRPEQLRRRDRALRSPHADRDARHRDGDQHHDPRHREHGTAGLCEGRHPVRRSLHTPALVHRRRRRGRADQGCQLPGRHQPRWPRQHHTDLCGCRRRLLVPASCRARRRGAGIYALPGGIPFAFMDYDGYAVEPKSNVTTEATAARPRLVSTTTMAMQSSSEA